MIAENRSADNRIIRALSADPRLPPFVDRAPAGGYSVPMFHEQVPEQVRAILDDFLPVMTEWFPGDYAVALGGSRGKGLADERSDLDFRYYYEHVIPDGARRKELVDRYKTLIDEWGARGFVIDGFWSREVSEIDRRIDLQLTGENITPEPLPWAIWGYELLTDLYCQIPILDPYGIVARWKEKLSCYPAAMKTAILKHHLMVLTYWRDDYHYVNKVERGDFLFAEGLALKLVNSMVRVIFALNEVYYVGDGNNLRFIEDFEIVPEGFADRVARILHRSGDPISLSEQRELLVELINDVEESVR